jgi:adenylate kinase
MPPNFDIVILLGAPGSGKGTQAVALATRLAVPHIASGDLLREHRAAATELGRAAQAAMDRGDLVPDELVSKMLLHRLEEPDAQAGALLDGFPRTVAQAATLDEYLGSRGGRVAAVIDLEVDEASLVERLAGRRTCPACQASYHVQFHAPRVAGVCDVCGARLAQRPDDQPAVVRNRVQVYLRQTAPLIDYYAARGVLRRVDGNRPIDAISADLQRLLPARAIASRR